MKDWIIDRLAAAFVGLCLGIVLALVLFVYIPNVNPWFTFIGFPLFCALVCIAFGDKALDAIKHIYSHWWH